MTSLTHSLTPLWIPVYGTRDVHDEGGFSDGIQIDAAGYGFPVFLVRRREELVSPRAAVGVGSFRNTPPMSNVDKTSARRVVAE